LRDLLSGVDTKKMPIDPNPIGITRWSYGGFMTMFNRHPDAPFPGGGRRRGYFQLEELLWEIPSIMDDSFLRRKRL